MQIISYRQISMESQRRANIIARRKSKKHDAKIWRAIIVEKNYLDIDCMFLSCHLRISACEYTPYSWVLAKWLSVCFELSGCAFESSCSYWDIVKSRVHSILS